MFFGRLVRDSYNCSADISRSVAASVFQNGEEGKCMLAHLEWQMRRLESAATTATGISRSPGGDSVN